MRKLLLLPPLVVLLGARLNASPLAQQARTFHKKVPANPEDVALHGELVAAQDAVSRGDYPSALQNYKDYLAKRPGDAQVHFNLGYVYSAMNRPADAKSEYERAIALDPAMQRAYQNLGLTLLPTDPAGAIQPLRKAAELAPADPAPKLALGQALEGTGDLRAAADQYRAALALHKDDPQAHLSLGRILLALGDTAEATSEFQATVALRPDLPEAHLGLAQSMAASGNRAAAEHEYAEYLRVRPADAKARIAHASLLAELGRADDALAELDVAEKRGGSDLSALKLRAQILLAQKRYEQAAAALQKAQSLAPLDPGVASQLGHTYLLETKYPDAAREFAFSWKLHPANDTLGNLVSAEYLGKNYAQALAALDLLAQREALDPRTWFVRADCYDKIGREAEALDAYQKFLQVNTDENSDMYFEAAARARVLRRKLKR